jgi:hypothetical protein
MRTHPDLAYDRVYAVTNRNKPLALFLSSLICAKAITACVYISTISVNGKFILWHPLARADVGY